MATYAIDTSARLYEYRVDAPGRPEHGRVIRFDARTCPAMHQRERYTLADGTMAHVDYLGPVQPGSEVAENIAAADRRRDE